MSTRPYKPADLPGLMPYLTVADPSKSISFYETAFGFTLSAEPMTRDGKIMHVEMQFLDARVMLGPEAGFGSKAKPPHKSGVEPGLSLYVYCRDVDAQFKMAKSADAKIRHAVEDQFWGDRCFQVEDPDGYLWTFAQNVAEMDPEKAA